MPTMPPSIVEPLQFSANFDSLIPAPLSRIPPEVDFPLLEGTVTGLRFDGIFDDGTRSYLPVMEGVSSYIAIPLRA
jgi:hypothetical protein